MRKVIVTYIDGRKEEYGSIVKASQALGCCKRLIERMGCGLSGRLMSRLGVEFPQAFHFDKVDDLEPQKTGAAD